jgi:transcriptional/translational regulatory protein YebC/TACO1
LAEVYTNIEELQDIRAALEEAGFTCDEVSVIYDPNNPIELDSSEALQVMKLVEILEDLDDVQNVYSALDISEETMAALETA